MTTDRMIVALDVDGTLFDGRSVDPAATAAVHAAVDDGHTVVIVTGRPWSDLATVIPDVLRRCAVRGVRARCAARRRRHVGSQLAGACGQ